MGEGRKLATIDSLVADDECPKCGGELDTGWECNNCGFDAKLIVIKPCPDNAMAEEEK